MTVPALLFGVLISTLYGLAFHLWRGGRGGRLILYLVLGWVGFWVGQIVGNQFDLTFVKVGPLNLGAATFFSAVFLGIGYWLSLVQVERK